MYEYIRGELVEATPANAVVDCGGVGYYIHISVNTYSKIASQNQVMLYIHQIVREDAHLLYGFFSKEERSLFRALISVSGIGANTANVMLSSMSVEEITGAILTENVNAIKSVKGIGVKTAQRVIIELKDKVRGCSCRGAESFYECGSGRGASCFGNVGLCSSPGSENFGQDFGFGKGRNS